MYTQIRSNLIKAALNVEEKCTQEFRKYATPSVSSVCESKGSGTITVKDRNEFPCC